MKTAALAALAGGRMKTVAMHRYARLESIHLRLIGHHPRHRDACDRLEAKMDAVWERMSWAERMFADPVRDLYEDHPINDISEI